MRDACPAEQRGFATEKERAGALRTLNLESHYFALLFSGREHTRKCFSPGEEPELTLSQTLDSGHSGMDPPSPPLALWRGLSSSPPFRNRR